MPESMMSDSSGGIPEKIGHGAPTVMPSGHLTRKPTVIGGGSSVPRPATMVTSSVDKKPEVLQPSRLPPSVGQRVAVVVQPAIPTTTGPSVLGKKRERIPLTLAELRKQNQNTEETVLEEALHLVQVFNTETVTDKVAMLWGTRVQQMYSDLVSAGLVLVRSELVSRTLRDFNRLAEILGSIRLDKVFGASGNGIISRLMRTQSKDVDTPAELERAEQEIDQIVSRMNASIVELLDLKDKMDANLSSLEKTRKAIGATALAARHIAGYLSASMSRQDLSDRFTEREMSLTQTFVQMAADSSIGQGQIRNTISLIGVVQQTVLSTVPLLLSNITAMHVAAMRGQKPTVTQINGLGDQIQDLIQKIGQ